VKISGRLAETTLGDVLGLLCRAKITGLVQLTETIGAAAGRIHGIHLSRGEVVSVDTRAEEGGPAVAVRGPLGARLEALFQLEDAAVSFHVACSPPPAADRPLGPAEVLPGRPRARDRKRRTSETVPVDRRHDERLEALRVLGLGEEADSADVARAFRTLAAMLHPDRHADATEAERRVMHRRFAAVSAAYHRLAS
jgi:hypothetical protein